MTQPLKQGTALIVRESFAFKAGGKGRAIVFKAGQPAWVTSSTLQNTSGVVNVGRPHHHIGCGYNLEAAHVARFFEVAA